MLKQGALTSASQSLPPGLLFLESIEETRAKNDLNSNCRFHYYQKMLSLPWNPTNLKSGILLTYTLKHKPTVLQAYKSVYVRNQIMRRRLQVKSVIDSQSKDLEVVLVNKVISVSDFFQTIDKNIQFLEIIPFTKFSTK